jgi:hypothetical protein
VSLVVYDEGLCSSKAIAFIQNSNKQNSIKNQAISYLQLGTILQKTVSNKQKPTEYPLKIGEKLWIN